MSDQMGWMCPGCGACWAPTVEDCTKCRPWNESQNVDTLKAAEAASDPGAGAVRGAGVVSGAGAEPTLSSVCTCHMMRVQMSGYCYLHQAGWGSARTGLRFP